MLSLMNFISSRRPAWHSVGKTLDSFPTFEEAMLEAGLDFKVVLKPIEHQGFIWDKNFMTVRTDNNQILGVVGSRYEVLQNLEAFDCIKSLVKDKILQIETGGCLGKGEIVFLSARLNEKKQSVLENGDIIENYILISSSHNGTSPLQFTITPTRVVCNNTLNLAFKEAKNKYVIRHTKNAKDKLKNIEKIVLSLDAYFDTAKQYYDKLLHRRSSNTDFIRNAAKFFTPTQCKINAKGLLEFSTPQARAKIETIYSIYQKGVGQENIQDTEYGQLNAVALYLDYENRKNIQNLIESDELTKFSQLLTV